MIKIAHDNDTKITAALDDVAGRAQRHAASYYHVHSWAAAAEAKLTTLGLPKTDRAGAVAIYESGDKMPSAYTKHGRTVRRHRVRLLRRASGWFIETVEMIDGNPMAAPTDHLILTAAQDEAAVACLRRGYAVSARA